MNDPSTIRNVGGQNVPCVRVTETVSDRIPEVYVSEIDYDNAFRTLTLTLSRLRAPNSNAPFHAENFHGRFGSTIITIISVIQNMERARQIDVAAGSGRMTQGIPLPWIAPWMSCS